MWLNEWMYLCYKMWKINKKSGILPPKPLKLLKVKKFSCFYIRDGVNFNSLILFEGLNILISTFCVCPNGYQGRSKTFHCPNYTVINFLFASLKLLTNFENAYWNPPQSSLLCDWSMFSSSHLSLAARINVSPAASGMIYRITGDFL